jgi:hypothetical protein
VEYRGRAALQRRVKGERAEQAFQACMKEAPRRAGFSPRGTSTQSGDSRPVDKLRAGSRLSTGPGSSLRHKVPEGPNENSPPVHWRGTRNTKHQPCPGGTPERTTPPRKHGARARPTPIPARSLDSHLPKTAKGGAAGRGLGYLGTCPHVPTHQESGLEHWHQTGNYAAKTLREGQKYDYESGD